MLEPYIEETPNFFEGNVPRDSLKCPPSAKLLVWECANRLFRGNVLEGEPDKRWAGRRWKERREKKKEEDERRRRMT